MLLILAEKLVTLFLAYQPYLTFFHLIFELAHAKSNEASRMVVLNLFLMGDFKFVRLMKGAKFYHLC